MKIEILPAAADVARRGAAAFEARVLAHPALVVACLLYTSDAADE